MTFSIFCCNQTDLLLLGSDAIAALRSENYSLWTSALNTTSISLDTALAKAPKDKKIALIFGNESRGTKQYSLHLLICFRKPLLWN